ncbi:MAG: DUF3267 domain-containing protein [Clostridia bacterium]|nr:DUF3267 domain-containing protein [Clostridia bacterium]
MKTSFYTTLPDGYDSVFHINAKSTKTGLALNLSALILAFIVMYLLTLLVDLSVIFTTHPLVLCAVFSGVAFSLLIYMILHELLHGIAYKLTTGRKLTFGISWSCAFCGVPDIYVTRKTALIALLTPFIFFSVLFVVALIFFIHNRLIFLAIGFVFAMHVGGCAGDLFVFLLLLIKFRSKNLLMKDTGPEQTFYLP